MNLEVFTQLGITVALGTYIWNDSKKRTEKLENKVEILYAKIESLERRIQKIEDIQGNKLDVLSVDFKNFKHDVTSKLDVLTSMIHKEKNQESILNNTLSLILKELEKKDK